MELQEISGIGKTRCAALNKAGIFSCEDLIKFLPRKYYDFLSPVPALPSDGYKMIRGTVKKEPKLMRIKKNFSITTVNMVDSFGNDFTAIWYNQPFINRAVVLDKEYFIYGRDDKKKKNSIVVSYFKDASKADNISLFPIYPRIESVPSEIIRHSVQEAMNSYSFYSLISPRAHDEFDLLELNKAYKLCHQPESFTLLEKAKKRIEIEKIIPLAHACITSKKIGRSKREYEFLEIHETLNEYKKLLPFNLTHSQESAICEIIDDLESDLSMNRLLEGDVGSGKTAIAFFTAFLAFKNGYQSVIMAPTEILAKQHYNLALKMFENVFGLRVVFLSSKLSASEKKRAANLVSSGEANIIIGSHSVFSKNIEYYNLALVVIDEQHKFGVRARAALLDKGRAVDTLTMSATPIPRSLALSLKGTLDISILESRPHALDIKTNIVSKYKLDDMWSFIDEKINENSKAFVVCPKIEESDDDDDMDGASAKGVYSSIKEKLKASVALVHGKMSPAEAEQQISDFKSGKAKVLVSTTIVEVGVDVKEADIIVIMNAHSFGLASLHQLRGRVGRDGKPAMCFCVVPNNISSNSLDRLKFFKNNTNGFKIAEFDLETRGAGTMDGTAQHGFDGLSFGFSTVDLDYAKKIVKSMQDHGEIDEKMFIEYSDSISKMVGDIALN